MKNLFTVLISSLLVLTSCSKDDEDVMPIQDPEIVVVDEIDEDEIVEEIIDEVDEIVVCENCISLRDFGEGISIDYPNIKVNLEFVGDTFNLSIVEVIDEVDQIITNVSGISIDDWKENLSLENNTITIKQVIIQDKEAFLLTYNPGGSVFIRFK